MDLKTYRKANNLNQLEMSKKLRISQSYYARIEIGECGGTLEIIDRIQCITEGQVTYDDIRAAYNQRNQPPMPVSANPGLISTG